MDAKLFGKNVLVLRKEKEFSQKELANLAGISRNYISMIERGEANNVSAEIIRKLAYSLGVTAEELTGEPSDSSALSVPPSLRDFAIQKGLSYKTVDKLRQIPFRGEEPETPEEWNELYEALKPYLFKK